MSAGRPGGYGGSCFFVFGQRNCSLSPRQKADLGIGVASVYRILAEARAATGAIGAQPLETSSSRGWKAAMGLALRGRSVFLIKFETIGGHLAAGDVVRSPPFLSLSLDSVSPNEQCLAINPNWLGTDGRR
jgi:hypothetical protein